MFTSSRCLSCYGDAFSDFSWNYKGWVHSPFWSWAFGYQWSAEKILCRSKWPLIYHIYRINSESWWPSLEELERFPIAALKLLQPCAHSHQIIALNLIATHSLFWYSSNTYFSFCFWGWLQLAITALKFGSGERLYEASEIAGMLNSKAALSISGSRLNST